MRSLIVLILVAFLAWAGYWALISARAETSFATWFDARQSEGWQAEYTNLDVTGFPNRIDANFENIALADPDTGLAWSAPFFQLLALSYQPNHVIAVWPNAQKISTPEQTLDILSDKMQASVVVEPAANLPLERTNFAAQAIAVTSNQGWTLAAEDLRIAFHKVPAETLIYDFAYQATGVEPPSFLRTSVLPNTMSAMDLSLQLSFDRPWDMRAIEERRPQPTSLVIRNAKAEWGDLSFQAAADLDIDVTGTPSGEATLRLKNWRRVVQMAKISGQFSDASVRAMTQFFTLVSRISGSGDNIDVTLRFSGGVTLVGVVPVGPAPKIQLP